MNICMFTNTYLPHVGGVARSVAFFAEDLRALGHNVLIIAPTFPGYEEHDLYDSNILRVPAIQKFNGSDFSIRIPTPFFVDEKLDNFKPDIIHSHHPYLLGDAALRGARRRNLPLIFTHHTLYEEYTHYISEDPDNMKRFAAFLSTNYANMCDWLVAPSLSIKQLIVKRGVNVPISEIPTGVDLSFFSKGDGKKFRKKYNIPEKSFLIGHIGRLAPEKNLDYLAKAAAKALEKDSDRFFLVVGEGPNCQSIFDIFAQSGLTNQLILTGKITGPELADAYGSMNIFAFASKTETQGMVLTEAMAAGVPVIALDAPGAREVVRDGENGCLLDTDASKDEFADMLSYAASSPEKVSQWNDNALKTAKSFSREKSAEKLMHLYEDALSERIENGVFKTENLDFWDKFLLACEAEWDLVSEKTESVIQAVDESRKVSGLDNTD